MKILVVDDDEDSRLMLCALLEGNGHEGIGASDGKQALISIQKSVPDLIVSDVLMPEMDGFELCRQVKGSPTFNRIPFVFYSATYTDKKDKDLALSLGALEFLSKPMEPDALVKRIIQIIKKCQEEYCPAPPSTLGPSEILQDKHIEVLTNKIYEKELREKFQSDFLNMTAHDIKCPLTIIMGYSVLIQKDPELHSEKIKAHANKIQAEVEKLSRMVDNLVQLSMIELGQGLTFKMETTDLVRLINDKIKVFEDCYPSHIFRVECQQGSLEAPIDKMKFDQVIDNLICNAIKYSKPNTSVLVKIEPKEDSIKITIRDEGIGMSSDQINRMFEKFYRAPSVAGMSGVGLGATIVKHIVDGHEGKIWVESAPDKGTAVIIEIPR